MDWNGLIEVGFSATFDLVGVLGATISSEVVTEGSTVSTLVVVVCVSVVAAVVAWIVRIEFALFYE